MAIPEEQQQDIPRTPEGDKGPNSQKSTSTGQHARDRKPEMEPQRPKPEIQNPKDPFKKQEI